MTDNKAVQVVAMMAPPRATAAAAGTTVASDVGVEKMMQISNKNEHVNRDDPQEKKVNVIAIVTDNSNGGLNMMALVGTTVEGEMVHLHRGLIMMVAGTVEGEMVHGLRSLIMMVAGTVEEVTPVDPLPMVVANGNSAVRKTLLVVARRHHIPHFRIPVHHFLHVDMENHGAMTIIITSEDQEAEEVTFGVETIIATWMPVVIGAALLVVTNAIVLIIQTHRRRQLAVVSPTIGNEVGQEEALATVHDERNVTETVTAEIETGKTISEEMGQTGEIDATETAAGMIEIEMVDVMRPKKNRSVGIVIVSRVPSGKIKSRTPRLMDPPLQKRLSAIVAEIKTHKKFGKVRLRKAKIPLLIEILVPLLTMSRKTTPRKHGILNRKMIQVSKILRER
jgi:hypothetical protein